MYLNRSNNQLNEALSATFRSRFCQHQECVESRSIPIEFENGGFGRFEEIDERRVGFEKIFRVLENDVAERGLFRPFLNEFLQFLEHVRMHVVDGADMSEDQLHFGGVKNGATGLLFVLQLFLEIRDRSQDAHVIFLRLQQLFSDHLALGDGSWRRGDAADGAGRTGGARLLLVFGAETVVARRSRAERIGSGVEGQTAKRHLRLVGVAEALFGIPHFERGRLEIGESIIATL